MTRTIVNIFSQILDRLGDYNSQLFRELKGRLKPRNMLIVSGLSLLGQIFLCFVFNSSLPGKVENYNMSHGFTNRYCLGSPPSNSETYSQYGNYIPDNLCIQDLLGNWILNDQLWWLDLFVWLSILGIFALLVIGSYLLIHDLSREENRGTLNFVRLSPQPVNNIVLGKILGVPSLLYLAGILALPLHLIAGLGARIPLTLLLGYYGVLIVSCGFFYSGAILFSLISSGLGIFQSFLGSGVVLFFLSCTTGIIMTAPENFNTPFDWVTLFHPAQIFPYLIDATFLPPKTVGYFSLNNLTSGTWYGLPIWGNLWIGMGFILLNYGVWIYWIKEGLKRRFRNSTTTLWSKKQGYLIGGSGIAILFGFVLQGTNSSMLLANFLILQLLSTICFILLIAAITPGRQTLQDWARYRHQLRQNPRSLVKDLLLGEKSPSVLAVSVSLGFFFVYVLPSLLISPLEHKTTVFAGLLLEVSLLLLSAVIFQFLVMAKPFKRTIGAMMTLGGLIGLPIICVLTLGLIDSGKISSATIFLTLLGEWVATILLSFQMSKQLQKIGESATKALLNSKQLPVNSKHLAVNSKQ